VNVDANKQLVERFYEEVWARGNVDFATEVFSDDYVRHDLRPAQAAPGAAGQARIAEQFRQAFPDLQWRIDLVFGEADLVAGRCTASGTHTGSWGDLPPTGKRAEFSGVNIFRFGRRRQSRRDLESSRRPRLDESARRGRLRGRTVRPQLTPAFAV
jgi:steroid delta-isomerase-like uncharacterized protein